MYVLCFRMRSAMDIPRLKSQLFLMPIEAILKHPLNPLKVKHPILSSSRPLKLQNAFSASLKFMAHFVHIVVRHIQAHRP